MLSVELKNPVEIACRSHANVLLTGPTGSGKSWLARSIHERSDRKNRPFITVNLATLHEGTIESELFGHERGAFTGAEAKRVGRLEMANGGTVFLDEIGELPPRLQARLLEFLQSRTISPVGGNRETKLDVRVIAATHRNLALAVEKGEFREDLFHRLRVVAISLKSVAERWDEFDQIVHDALEQACESSGRKIFRIDEKVAEILEGYSWPGNLRELKNVLEFAALASDGPEVTIKDLPRWFLDAVENKSAASNPIILSEMSGSLDYQSALIQFEKQFLKFALQRYRGRVNKTAREIGLNKTTLIRRMRAYGLQNSAHFS